jgi:hypothetical protein
MCPVTQGAYRALQMDKKQQENIQSKYKIISFPLATSRNTKTNNKLTGCVLLSSNRESSNQNDQTIKQ